MRASNRFLKIKDECLNLEIIFIGDCSANNYVVIVE